MDEERLLAIEARAKMTLDHDILPPLARGVIGGDIPDLTRQVRSLEVGLQDKQELVRRIQAILDDVNTSDSLACDRISRLVLGKNRTRL